MAIRGGLFSLGKLRWVVLVVAQTTAEQGVLGVLLVASAQGAVAAALV